MNDGSILIVAARDCALADRAREHALGGSRAARGLAIPAPRRRRGG